MAKIAIFIDHDIMIRHFVLNRVLAPLEREHEVVYIFPENHKRVKSNLGNLPIPRYRTLAVSNDRVILYRRLYHSAVLKRMRRTPDKRSAFQFWKDSLGRRDFFKAWLFSWPVTFPLRRRQLLARIGRNLPLEQLLTEEKPSLLLHPTVLEGLFVSDLLRWGQAHGTPTIFLMNSWDNPATKAMMVGSPDRLVVWGEHSKHLAITRLGIPAEKIICLGGAQFDVYQRPPKEDCASFRGRLGIGPEEKVLLYAGSSKGLNEARHLEILDQAVTEGRMPTCRILYRPHPWRQYPSEEKDFFKVHFKNVLMDPHMGECYRQGRSGERMYVELADYEDTHVVLNAVDAVISPLSTMLLEAAMHGKPIAVYIPDEDLRANTFLFTMANMAHFKDFLEQVDCIKVEVREKLVDDCSRLLQMTNTPGLPERLKAQCRFFVETSAAPYGERLNALIGQQLQSRSLSTQNPSRVLWVYRRGRKERLANFEKGEEGSEFFYGMMSLARHYGTAFAEDGGWNPFQIFWHPIEKIFSRRVGLGCALPMALRHIDAFRQARVVIATNDACGLPVALLKKVGLLRTRLVYMSQGLSDRLQRYGLEKWLSRQVIRLLNSEVDRFVVLGQGARQGLSDCLRLDPGHIEVIPFGVDTQFWAHTGTTATAREILSVGSDQGRDYPTLFEASQGLPLHIISRQRLRIDLYPNIRQTSRHPSVELRKMYSEASFIVIPLHDQDQPSGQSSVLQAMACRKAVIVTRTRGWWGGDFLQDGVHCLFVPPGDVRALKEAIHTLWRQPERLHSIGLRAREAVVNHFSEQHLANAMGRVIESCNTL